MGRPVLTGVCAAVLLSLPMACAAAEPAAAGDPFRARQWGLDVINAPPPSPAEPVVVAVIDSGLDYQHPDLAAERIWRNTAERPNGRDDDGNGYVDDLIGWNFYGDDNNPWDLSGHGTHVAGIIAATAGNRIGIAGAAPNAVIMPLKVLNFGGYGYGPTVAEAVYYAVRQGAGVINLSLGSRGESAVERQAIAYAGERGVVVVAASGNGREDLAAWGPAGYPGIVSVAALTRSGKAAEFSNFGRVSLAAPGQDIVSLRARRTDLGLLAEAGDAGADFVGRQAQLIRASGTSFAAPYVAAAAAVLRGRRPELSAAEVARMLRNSARDTAAPGIDRRTGYGLLNVSGALQAHPDDYIAAAIDSVQVVQGRRGPAARVVGSADGNRLRAVRLEIGTGTDPHDWHEPVRANRGVIDGELASIPASAFAGAGVWTLRLLVTHVRLGTREFRYELKIQ